MLTSDDSGVVYCDGCGTKIDDGKGYQGIYRSSEKKHALHFCSRSCIKEAAETYFYAITVDSELREAFFGLLASKVKVEGK